jgi:hypothetical protein
VVTALRSSSTQEGRCQEVFQRDVPRNVDWTSMADFMASLSPDGTAIDSFLSIHLIEHIYAVPPRTFDDL